MKITYIHQHFAIPTQAGGVRSWEFGRRLVARGHQVHVIAAGEEAKTIELEGVKVQYLPVSYANEMSTLRRVVSFARFAVRSTIAAARVPADLVFATSTPLTVAVPGMVASVVQRAPFVFEVRDLWPEVPIRLGVITNPVVIAGARALEWLAYAKATTIIALSPGMTAGVKQVLPRARVVEVPNASDFVEMEKIDDRTRFENEGRHLVLYAGSMGWSYEVEWGVRLAAELKDAPVDFLFLGEGASSEHCRELARELGLDPAQVLPGEVPKAEVMARLRESSLALSTLIDEPVLGMNSLNKVFDAMAAHRPVLFNHDGWLATLMDDAQAGWKLDREDIAASADKVRQLLADPTALRAAGERAADLGRANFDRDLLFERFLEALESSVDRGRLSQRPVRELAGQVATRVRGLVSRLGSSRPAK